MNSKFTGLHFFLFFFILSFISISNAQNADPDQFTNRNYWKNAIDLTESFQSFTSEQKGMFSDLGAWHGYSFPETMQGNFFFCGPYLFDRQNISLFTDNIKLKFTINNKEVEPEKIVLKDVGYFPGMITLTFESEGFTIFQRLIFINQRTSLIQVEFVNQNRQSKNVKIELGSHFNRNEVYTQSTFSRGVKLYLKSKGGAITTRFMDTVRIKTYADSVSFSISTTEKITIESGESYPFYITQTYCTSQPDDVAFKGLKTSTTWKSHFVQNEKRWNNYLRKVFQNDSVWLKQENYARVAVKSLMTLITNWRSANDDLKHDGIFPSLFGYDGFWAWDSWKQAAACAIFDPELGKNSIRAMFDHQTEDGMIPDCIFSDKKQNNFRNTKPPLASWAVWKLFEATRDTNFLWETVHVLFKYHNWWYLNRDHDKNGLCEYGSNDGTIEAAKWESGMDNAARFDSISMLKNINGSWSMDQESVDLNSYLYFDKLFLVKISEITKAQSGIETGKDAIELQKSINRSFFDDFSGYFYDRNIQTDQLVKTKGPEGWIPLWANVAEKNHAKQIATELADPNTFNTFLPFPTVDKSHSSFNPVSGYWRGPVWFDQAAFAISGLRNYGFNLQANEMLKKMLDNAQGLTGNDPLYENYDPLTGKGLNSPHFSWTAAHLLLLLCE